MAEYIDAKYLFKCTTCTNCRNGRCNTFCDHFESYTPNLNLIPTADVVEVRHGEWVEDGYSGNPCVCSYCGEEAQYTSRFEETFDYDWEENLQPTGYEEIREYIRTPYCHNCGAKMDGKDGAK